jgi:alpha,alpha-trehalose phosphorylase
MTLRRSRIRVEVRRSTITFTLEEGDGAEVEVRGRRVVIRPGEPTVVGLEGQGPVLTGVPSTSDLEGSRREDGSLIFASVPTPAPEPLEDDEEAPQLGPV